MFAFNFLNFLNFWRFHSTVEVRTITSPVDKMFLNIWAHPRGHYFIYLKLCLFGDAYRSQFFFIKLPVNYFFIYIFQFVNRARCPVDHFNSSKNFCTKILLGIFSNLIFSLLILTCCPTLYLAFFIRTFLCLFCILFHIASTSESVTLVGAKPVELWTEALQPATKSWSALMYLYVFLWVKNL